MKKIFTPLLFLFLLSAFARVYGSTKVTMEASPCYYTGDACKTCGIYGSGEKIVYNFSAYIRMNRAHSGSENRVFSPAFFHVIAGKGENGGAEPPPSCPKPILGSFVFNVQQNCGTSVITHNGDRRGYNVYWQNSPTGVSTVNLNRDHTITREGVYYIRARASCGTWGDAIATPRISVKSIPPATQISCSVTSICSGQGFYFFVSNNSNCSNQISVNASSSVTGANSGTYSQPVHISQVLTNYSRTLANVVYTVTPVSGGCRGTSSTLTITVNPKPIVGYTVNLPCTFSQGTVRISLSSTTPGASISWGAYASGNTSAPSGMFSGNTIEHQVYNTTSIASPVKFRVVPSINGCNGDTVYPSIIVYPLPVISFQRPSVSSVTLSTYNTYASYAWINESGQVVSSTYTLTTVPYGKYRVRVGICNGSTRTSEEYTILPPTPNAIIETISCSPTRIAVKNAPPANASWYWQTEMSGTSMQYPSTGVFPVSVTKNYYLRSKMGNTWSLPQTIHITSAPVPTASVSDYSICSGYSTHIIISNNASTIRNEFTVQSNGISGAQSGLDVANRSISQTLINNSTSPKTVVYTITPVNSTCKGNPVTSTITVNPRPVISNAPMQYTFTGNYLTLPLSSNVSNTTYFWSVLAPTTLIDVKLNNNDYYTSIQGSSSRILLSHSQSSNQLITFRVVPNSNGCYGQSTNIACTIFPLPVVTASNTRISASSPVTLSFSGIYDRIEWRRDGESAVLSTGRSCTTTQPGKYSATITRSGATGVATHIIGLPLQGVNRNYIVEKTIKFSTAAYANYESYDYYSFDNTPIERASEVVQYFDGLGRPDQTVLTQNSPAKSDLVTAKYYNQYGLETRQFLPVSLGSSGRYKENLLDNAGNFAGVTNYNNGSADKVADDTRPFQEVEFEASPLKRPLKQYGPGIEWKTANKNTDYEYLTNTIDEVLFFQYDRSTTRKLVLEGGSRKYYPAGQLYVKVVTDEDNHRVREYTDKQGRTVCKKYFPGGIPASTYYVFDAYGNLSFVVSPEAANFLQSNNLQQTTLDNLCFQYKYDSRQRRIESKLPGVEPTYYVYDNRDRLALTQDGELRKNSNNKWLFTKYDNFNRPVLTGIHTISGDRTAVQTLVNNFYKTASSSWGETSGQIHGYSNTTYPNVSDESKYLTVSYYDNYATSNTWTGYGFVNYNLRARENDSYYSSPAFNTRVKTLLTATKTKIMGSNTWLKTVNYYDSRDRLIEQVAENHLGGKDITAHLLNFVGNILRTKNIHSTNNLTTTTENTFVYDHAGRLLENWYSINSSTPVLLAQNQYNEIGQLVDKKLHIADNSFLQSIDYRYNIRGWLTHINNSALTQDNNNDDANDLFGMNLFYNSASGLGTGGLGTGRFFNGNISAWKWSSLGEKKERGYTYSYDHSNRMMNAYHFEKVNTWTGVNNFDENLSYDLNGNIKLLNRHANAYGETFTDKLSYTYNGNQLLAIRDEGSVKGFTDLNTNGNDYFYDANGNMTVDKNKEIQSISYNHLNLPVEVVKKSGDKLKFTYTATGQKLSQEITYSNGNPKKTIDYAGLHYYENKNLLFVSTAEGRVVMKSTPEYQYFLKDHLGNNRMVLTTKKETEETRATLETAYENTERSNFVNYPRAVKINASIFDHTKKGPTYYSSRLSGTVREKYGLARSLSVMPGDKVWAEVFAKYLDTNQGNRTTALNNFLAAILAGTALGGTIVDGRFTGQIQEPTRVIAGKNNDNSLAPKAYLNWLIFDRNYSYITGGFKQISTTAREYGQNCAHERLTSGEINITQPGYVYFYLSNENLTPVEVYFDDFKVSHTKSPIVQTNDYYPYGMTFNSHSRENSTPQRFKFQGQENIDDLKLNWDSFKWRNYSSETGRFFNMDPMAYLRYWASPYNFCQNNPVIITDPDGALDEPVYGSDGCYRGNTKEGFTGKAIIYDGKEDFSKMSSTKLLSMDGADTYDNRRGNLTGNAKSNIWTHIVSQMEGQQIYDEKFSISSIENAIVYHDASEEGSWNSRPKSMDKEWRDRITGTDKYSYATTVENIQSSVLVHEWYSHLKKGQGNYVNLNSHRNAYKNVINFKSLWDKTTEGYKGFNMRRLKGYTSDESKGTKAQVDPLYRNLYNKYYEKYD